MGYERLMTGFQKAKIGNLEVQWIGGTEGFFGVHSIIDPNREKRPVRILADWTEESLEEDEDIQGLIVFGIYKGDRPSPEDVSDHFPEYAREMAIVKLAIDKWRGGYAK